MEIGLVHFLIICPLVFLAGVVDAVAGGGGLISLPAYLISGLPVHNAIATNKTAAAMGTALTTYRYVRNGYVPFRTGIVCVVFGLIGSTIGAQIALLISDGIFKIIMLVIIPLTALYLLTRGDFSKERSLRRESQQILMCIPIAFGLGIYDGFYGPGMGTFLMIVLTGWVHMNIRNANGICKVINMATNIAAFAVYFFSGKVILALGLVAGLFSIAGNYVGAKYFESGNTKFVKPLMMVVLVIFFIKLLLEVMGVLA